MDPLSHEFVNFVTRDKPLAETKKLYDQWTNDYEKAMVNVAYNGPLVTAIAFDELGLKKNVKILDIGAGTGQLGKELKSRGYSDLDALDPSEMIQKAKEQSIYKNYYSEFVKLGQPLSLAKNSYDVAIMSGVMTPGHMHVEDLLEVAKIVKTGGLICWVCTLPSVYDVASPKYSSKVIQQVIEAYIKDGIWSYHQPRQQISNYYKNEDGHFYAMKVL